MNTLQKAWERSRNIIRKAQGHDQHPRLACYWEAAQR